MSRTQRGKVLGSTTLWDANIELAMVAQEFSLNKGQSEANPSSDPPH